MHKNTLCQSCNHLKMWILKCSWLLWTCSLTDKVEQLLSLKILIITVVWRPTLTPLPLFYPHFVLLTSRPSCHASTLSVSWLPLTVLYIALIHIVSQVALSTFLWQCASPSCVLFYFPFSVNITNTAQPLLLYRASIYAVFLSSYFCRLSVFVHRSGVFSCSKMHGLEAISSRYRQRRSFALKEHSVGYVSFIIYV